jgi:HSP20 family protein
MTALTRIDDFDDMIPQLFRGFLAPMRANQLREPGDLRVDISENDKAFTVRAEIPGARKDDIRVSVSGDTVSISAEVKKESEEKEGRAVVRERYFGSSSRSFRLGSALDDKAAEAKFEGGVLTLTLPKRAEASSKLVPIL